MEAPGAGNLSLERMCGLDLIDSLLNPNLCIVVFDFTG